VAVLLANGADPALGERLPIEEAAAFHDWPTFDLLLDAGHYSPAMLDRLPRSVFNDPLRLRMLLILGASPDAVLAVTVYGDCYECAKMALDAGADPTAPFREEDGYLLGTEPLTAVGCLLEERGPHDDAARDGILAALFGSLSLDHDLVSFRDGTSIPRALLKSLGGKVLLSVPKMPNPLQRVTSLGPLLWLSRDKVMVYVDQFCGLLCGVSQLVTLERTPTGWHVTSTRQLSVS
jgi:hypothetical protein